MSIKLDMFNPDYDYVKGFIRLHSVGDTCIFHVSLILKINQGSFEYKYSPQGSVHVRVSGQGRITDCHFRKETKASDFVAFLMEKMLMWAEKKERG